MADLCATIPVATRTGPRSVALEAAAMAEIVDWIAVLATLALTLR